jgi:callose synthase
MDTIQWPPFLIASKVYALICLYFTSLFFWNGVCLIVLIDWIQIPVALDMVSLIRGYDGSIKKKMKLDPYMAYAIKECYATFKNIIYTLVVGPRERESMLYIFILKISINLKFLVLNKLLIFDIYFRLIENFFTIVDDNITRDTLIKELNMISLHVLYSKFVQLLELLV